MNKPCLILDLDETVISTLTWNEIRQCQKENSDDCKFLNDNIDKLEKYDWHYDKIPPPQYGKGPTRDTFVTFERPGLQDFLDFAFENFRVFIWTAGSPEYAVTLTENIILRKNKDARKIHGVFNSYHVDVSESTFGPLKDLRLLWETFNDTLPEGSRCTEYDTIIMDDNELVHEPYPSNCLYMKPLDFQKPRKAVMDTLLKTIQKQLTVLLKYRADKNQTKTTTARLLVKATYGTIEDRDDEIDRVAKLLDKKRPLDVKAINMLNDMI
jgi:hypothetical protein